MRTPERLAALLLAAIGGTLIAVARKARLLDRLEANVEAAAKSASRGT